MTRRDKGRETHPARENENRVSAVALAAFCIWLGIAWLFGFGWGLGLLGAAVITLGAQVARKAYGLPFEGFWLVAGLLFGLGGVWELASVQAQLVPVVLIVAGLAILASRIWPRRTRTHA